MSEKPSTRQRAPLPRCELEVLNPDDVLVIGLNERWYRTFTVSSDRYPLRMELPGEFLLPSWNLLTGEFTNVALAGHRQEACPEYRLLVDGEEVLHVLYRMEVQPHTFTIKFKDTFALHTKAKPRVVHRQTGTTRRFDDLMQWSKEAPPES